LAASVDTAQEEGSEPLKWYSIVPPLLAIVLAFLTRRVLLSLGLAFVAGSLLVHIGSDPVNLTAWLAGIKTVGTVAAGTLSSKSNLQVLAFIPPIFVMIQLVIVSGGFTGILLWMSRWIKSSRSAQTATALMGVVCFIDDYANAMIVGSMMQPVTDRFRVSREKLAFIVDATSAPISGLAIISTWIAYEVGLFNKAAQQLGLEKSGYSMFFDALSYRFYCVSMIAFVFLLILIKTDFGPMRTAQALARNSDPGGKNKADRNFENITVKSNRAMNALIPLCGFLLFHLVGLWFDGGGPAKLAQGGSLLSWVYLRDVIASARHTTLVLDSAAVFGLLLALICSRYFGSLNFAAIKRCFRQGIKRALIPCAILILAWSLRDCCQLLKTGKFLSEILADKVSPQWFPAILFLVASLTSFATGTSYGTMAILIPTGIPIAFALDGNSYGLTTMMSLGAILDGAIFGDHCSPISDTTILSSISTSCNLVKHVRTQLPYSILVGVLALVFAYIPCGFGLNPGWALLLVTLIMTAILLIVARKKKTNLHKLTKSGK
jgi:Na+/H+ antiporter NhaC